MEARTGRVISVASGAGASERYATALEGAGFPVETTADPAACLERIAAGADCVVSAYRLDGTDGIELLREVRERYPDLPFVLVASEGGEAVASEAIAAGVTEYVPIDGSVPTDLADRVAGAIGRASHARERRQQELHDVYERISDAFCAVDGSCRLTYVNERAEELLGADRETLLGECLWEAFPEAGGTDVRDALAEAVETGQATESELHYGPLDTWLDARIYPSETGLSVYLRDVTDRVERERVLREAYEIVSAPGRSFTQQVGALLELGCEVLGTDYATLSRVRDDEYVFERVVAPADADLQPGDTIPLGITNCERVVETERTLVLGDVQADAPDLAERAANAEWGLSSYIGAPVSVDGEVTGTFCFYDKEPRTEPFSEWAVTFVELLADWVSRQIERERYADRLAGLDTAFPDLGFCLDANGRYLECLAGAAASELLYVEPDALLGRTLHEVLPAETADLLLEATREAIETGELRTVEYELEVPAGVRWFEGRLAPLTDGEYGPDTVILVARDVTERKARERDLERQRDELAHLHRINTLVRGITRALQDATTRDAIETAVCEHLTESNLYRTAWIGTRGGDVAGEVTVVPRTAAGVGVGGAPLEGIPGTDGAAGRAVRSGDVQIVDGFEGATGNRALAAVPLAAGETTYGVLVVYAPRDETIDEAEREVLADLG
jgi:PAS domain S-box-containing protein